MLHAQYPKKAESLEVVVESERTGAFAAAAAAALPGAVATWCDDPPPQPSETQPRGCGLSVRF